MRTEDLIRTLAEDTQVGPSPRRSLRLATLGSVAFVAVLFWVTMGPRPDVPELLTGSWRFALKVAFALSLALLAARGVLRLANPVESPRRAALDLLPAVLLLALGVAAEAYSKAGADVMLRLAIGHNGRICLVEHHDALRGAASRHALCHARRRTGFGDRHGCPDRRDVGRVRRRLLRAPLHRQLAAVRRPLVHDRHRRRDRRRRASGSQAPALVKASFAARQPLTSRHLVKLSSPNL